MSPELKNYRLFERDSLLNMSDAHCTRNVAINTYRNGYGIETPNICEHIMTDEDGSEICSDGLYSDMSFDYIYDVVLAVDEYERVNNCSATHDPLVDEYGSSLRHVLDLHGTPVGKRILARAKGVHVANRQPMRGFSVPNRAGYRIPNKGNGGTKY